MKVFSFCLYGPFKRLYYHGLLDNLDLITRYYPDWMAYIYVGSDVDAAFIDRLRARSQVVIRETVEIGAMNMIHRFYAIDEPEVDMMVVRDADSRIHWKDRWGIQAFVDSPYVAHTIRDNRVHTAKLMGGIWGMRKCEVSMQGLYEQFTHITRTEKLHGYDQDFLAQCLYPLLRDRMLVILGGDAPSFPNEHVLLFPFTWRNDIYCGRVEAV